MVWDFINHNRSHLEHTDEYEPNKVYPSRRSWKRLSDCLLAAGLLDEGADPTGVASVYHLSTAFVGFEAAVAFNDFVSTYERQVTPEMILDQGQTEKTSAFGINEHCALVEKMEGADIFKEKLSDERMQNLTNYFVTLPSEAAMKLWSIIGREDQGSLDGNIVGLHRMTSTSGTKVAEFITKILTGGKSS